MSGAKRSEPEKKSMDAPAYMGQYASLMTILLAFFIIMLTLGQDRVNKYKSGVGLIRNLIGKSGGTGVLEFWRTLRRPPSSDKADIPENDDIAVMASSPPGLRDGYSLNDGSLNSIGIEDPSKNLRLHTSIQFEPGRLRVEQDSQFELDRTISMLQSIRDFNIVVQVLVSTGAPAADRQLAARQAAWLARYIAEQARIPYDHIRSIGVTQEIGSGTEHELSDVVFMLRPSKRKQQDTL